MYLISKLRSDLSKLEQLVSPALLTLSLLFSPNLALAIDFSEKSADMWSTIDWNIENVSYNGNPFDVISDVTFQHQASGRTITTQMYFNGDGIWKFRFTGVKPGRWTFTTDSSNTDLDGHTGSIDISPNTNGLRGFLKTNGNQFAIQTSDEDTVEPYLFNVYMNPKDYFGWHNISNFDTIWSDVEAITKEYVEHARDNGSDIFHNEINNSWFAFNKNRHDEHNSENPDLKTFSILERMLKAAHENGGRVHLWAWGDESRKWTPIGVGGINGVPDKRLQRYIAARLGPLPGWTLSYGFDLQEWVTESQIQEWANYLKAHFGWSHLLMARGRSNSALDVKSYSGWRTVWRYDDALANLQSETDWPQFYEERFTFQRGGIYTEELTRRLMWEYAMAGGHASFWGFFETQNNVPYPNAQQLSTHYRFWHERKWQNTFNITPKRSDNHYALESGSRTILYGENTVSFPLDFFTAPQTYDIIAVDTKRSFEEVSLGNDQSGLSSIQLPYQSDWALVLVGDGEDVSAPTPMPSPTIVIEPTLVPAELPTEVPFTSTPVPEATSTSTSEPTDVPVTLTPLPTNSVTPTFVASVTPTPVAVSPTVPPEPSLSPTTRPTSTSVPPTVVPSISPTLSEDASPTPVSPSLDPDELISLAIDLAELAISLLESTPIDMGISNEQATVLADELVDSLRAICSEMRAVIRDANEADDEVRRRLISLRRTIYRRVIRKIRRRAVRSNRAASLFRTPRHIDRFIRDIEKAVNRLR